MDPSKKILKGAEMIRAGVKELGARNNCIVENVYIETWLFDRDNFNPAPGIVEDFAKAIGTEAVHRDITSEDEHNPYSQFICKTSTGDHLDSYRLELVISYRKPKEAN